jgi:hypothetical protein
MNDAKLRWQERVSTSKFVASVWTCRALAETSHTVLADPCISIALVRDDQGIHVFLQGPTTKPHNELLKPGYECTSIRLRPGVVMRNLSSQKLINNSLMFSVDAKMCFLFEGTRLQSPDFDTAEVLIDQLCSLGYLNYEASNDKVLSTRSYSRSIKRTTGFSPYRLYQLQRAHQALKLLKQGMSATAVAAELKFVDESHLTRVVKQFLGHTPKQLLYLPQAP